MGSLLLRYFVDLAHFGLDKVYFEREWIISGEWIIKLLAWINISCFGITKFNNFISFKVNWSFIKCLISNFMQYANKENPQAKYKQPIDLWIM